jgi:prefoldin subunit 5
VKPEDLSLAKERIAGSFKDLSIASNKLNSAADELTATVSNLEKLLKNLNLRVSAWHQISRSMDEDGTERTRDIGYANVEGKWGIAIRKTSGNANFGEFDEEVWRFADAPRWMCADAVSKLPDLIQALLKRTVETTENIKAKTEVAKEIVAATATVAAEIVATTRRAK